MALTNLKLSRDEFLPDIPTDTPTQPHFGVFKQAFVPSSSEPIETRLVATWAIDILGDWTWHRATVLPDGTVTDYTANVEDEYTDFLTNFYNDLSAIGWFADCSQGDYNAVVAILDV